MGFSVTTLAQKARTATLIADSDLNLGNYDLIATDVKGDTAEFSEFVGGVGNFTSGIISGGLDVSGIMHAESTLQADGNIILEGSINNVNIADDGEITTTKGVNGADFNGAIITATTFNGATIDSAGNVTANDFIYTGGYKVINVSPSDIQLNDGGEAAMIVLPYVKGVKYSGTIGGQIYRGSSSSIGKIITWVLKNGVWTKTQHTLSASATETFTFTFENIDMLSVYQSGSSLSPSSPKSFIYLPLFT